MRLRLKFVPPISDTTDYIEEANTAFGHRTIERDGRTLPSIVLKCFYRPRTISDDMEDARKVIGKSVRIVDEYTLYIYAMDLAHREWQN